MTPGGLVTPDPDRDCPPEGGRKVQGANVPRLSGFGVMVGLRP